MPSDRIHRAAGAGAPFRPDAITEEPLVESSKGEKSAQNVDSMGPNAPTTDKGPEGPSREYIVFMPKEQGATGESFEGLGRLMRAKQDTKQSALSCSKRGRYVVNLSDAEVAEYQRAGLKIVENVEIKAPEPVEAQEDAFTPQNTVARSVHGAAELQAREPGWAGENSLIVVADTGIATHSLLKPTILFDDVATPAPSDPQRDSGQHGTHVAGIANAIGNGENEVRGIAPNAELAGALVLDGGSGSLATVMAGIQKTIEWANSEEWKDKPVILNMSLGASAAGDRERDALAELANEAMREHGIFVVSSAGNSGPGLGTVGTPAWGKDVFAVAATDHRGTARTDDDGIARFSSRGDPNGGPGQNDKPDISAGGVAVLSTIPGDRTARFSGTSMASPQVAGAGAALLGKFYELWEAGMTRVSPRELVRSGEFQKILEETAADFENLPPHVDGAGDLRMVEAADLMLERFTLREVVERETAFKEIIQGLEADDGEITVRDEDDILQAVVELNEGISRADDRIEFLGRAMAVFDAAKDKLSPSTASRVEAVAADLASEAAVQLAESKPLTVENAKLAWSTMMNWRTRGTEVANPYNALSYDNASELSRLVNTAAANLPETERVSFLSGAMEAIEGGDFDGYNDLDATIRAQAYSTFENLAEKPQAPQAAIENIASYNRWLSSDPELSNRVKTRMLSTAFVKSVAMAPSSQAKVEICQAMRDLLRTEGSGFGLSVGYVQDMSATIDRATVDAIKDRSEEGFDTAGEALSVLQTAWGIHLVDGGRTADEDAEFFHLLQSAIDQSATRFVQREDEREAFKAGVVEMLNSVKPSAEDAEALKGWRQLRRTLYTRLNDALLNGMN